MKKKILKGSVPYLQEKWGLQDNSLPYLMLNLPYDCNYRCLKCCNVTESFNVKKNEISRNALTVDRIIKLIEDAGANGFKVLVIAGEGEPLLHKDFETIIKVANQNNLIPYVFTNGSLLSTEKIIFLAKQRASIIVSMDSLQPARYKKLTSNGNIEKVIANINNCRRIYSEINEDTDQIKIVSLAINTVVTQINIDEIEQIKLFCGNDIVFVCNQPTCIGLAEKNWETLYNTILPENDISNIVNSYTKENGPLGSTPDGKWCAYMKYGVSIGYDGSILACAYAIDSKGFYGKYDNGNLKTINKLVTESVDKFYCNHGHSRCLLRHPKYTDWIKDTSKQHIVSKIDVLNL